MVVPYNMCILCVLIHVCTGFTKLKKFSFHFTKIISTVYYTVYVLFGVDYACQKQDTVHIDLSKKNQVN